jgi:glycosyltransferase involved in cell wall biosynthesis
MVDSQSEPRPHKRPRVAVVVSHAIQYTSPWFAHVAASGEIDLRVFYLWDFGVTARYDRQFDQTLKWDIPLLDGYEYEYVPNRSNDPGTHHFRGLDNPDLVDRVASWSPDVIILFGYAFLSHMRLILSRRLRGIPMLLRGDSHDLSRTAGLRSFAGRIMRRILFTRFAAFLAVGSANASYYRNCGVPDWRIHFVPHCVDNERFRQFDSTASVTRWKREFEIPDGVSTILYAGKFEPEKRISDLIEAFFAMPRSTMKPDPVLVLVGAGSLEKELREQVSTHIGRDVFFVPFQNQSKMPLVYAAADLFVLPSGNETWGLAVNESMNLGRPAVVSSNVGCGPDLIVPDVTGWIFEAGNVNALAETMDRALADREHLCDVGAAARRHIDGYSYEAATLRMTNTLRVLLANA